MEIRVFVLNKQFLCMQDRGERRDNGQLHFRMLVTVKKAGSVIGKVRTRLQACFCYSGFQLIEHASTGLTLLVCVRACAEQFMASAYAGRGLHPADPQDDRSQGCC